MANNNFATIMSEEFREKMNIGADGRMQLTPTMMEALGISPESLAAGDGVPKPEMSFERVKLSSLEKRPITAQEYSRLPLASRRGIHQLFNAGYFFVLVFLVIFGFFVITNSGMEQYGLKGKLVAGAFFFLLLLIITIGTINKGMPKNAQVARGKLLFAKARQNSRRHIEYYLTVAFPEEKKYVDKLACFRSTYKNVEADSDIFIYKKRGYAAGK